MEEDEKNYFKDRGIEKTNEEYRNKLKDLFDKMDDNNKLRFWYKYISGIEGEG